MNLLCEKYPPSTIMKSHYFTAYLQDIICTRLKIISNTTKVLAYNLMKRLYKRAKLLTSPMLVCMKALL